MKETESRWYYYEADDRAAILNWLKNKGKSGLGLMSVLGVGIVIAGSAGYALLKRHK